MSKRVDFSRFHNEIYNAMNNSGNNKRTGLEAKDIIASVQSQYPHIPSDEIQPADHCSNHSNKGPCDCSMTDKAIFIKVGQSTGRGRGFIYDVR